MCLCLFVCVCVKSFRWLLWCWWLRLLVPPPLVQVGIFLTMSAWCVCLFVCFCVAPMCWDCKRSNRRGGVSARQSVCVSVLTGGVTLRAGTSLSTCLQVLVPLRTAPLLSIGQFSAQLSSVQFPPILTKIGLHLLRLLKLPVRPPSRHLLCVLIFLTATVSSSL